MSDFLARIKPKRSTVPGERPSALELEVGEIAISTADGKIFTKHTDGSIKEISGTGGGGGGGSIDQIEDIDNVEPRLVISQSGRIWDERSDTASLSGWEYDSGSGQLQLNKLAKDGFDVRPTVAAMPATGPIWISLDDVTYEEITYSSNSIVGDLITFDLTLNADTATQLWIAFENPYSVGGSLDGDILQYDGTVWRPITRSVNTNPDWDATDLTDGMAMVWDEAAKQWTQGSPKLGAGSSDEPLTEGDVLAYRESTADFGPKPLEIQGLNDFELNSTYLTFKWAEASRLNYPDENTYRIYPSGAGYFSLTTSDGNSESELLSAFTAGERVLVLIKGIYYSATVRDDADIQGTTTQRLRVLFDQTGPPYFPGNEDDGPAQVIFWNGPREFTPLATGDFLVWNDAEKLFKPELSRLSIQEMKDYEPVRGLPPGRTHTWAEEWPCFKTNDTIINQDDFPSERGRWASYDGSGYAYMFVASVETNNSFVDFSDIINDPEAFAITISVDGVSYPSVILNDCYQVTNDDGIVIRYGLNWSINQLSAQEYGEIYTINNRVPEGPYYNSLTLSIANRGAPPPVEQDFPLENGDILKWNAADQKFKPAQIVFPEFPEIPEIPEVPDNIVELINGRTGTVSLGIQGLDDFALGELPANLYAGNTTKSDELAVTNPGDWWVSSNTASRTFVWSRAGQDTIMKLLEVGDVVTLEAGGITETTTVTTAPRNSSNGTGAYLSFTPSLSQEFRDVPLGTPCLLTCAKFPSGGLAPIADGDILQWDDSAKKFKPAQPPESSGGGGEVDLTGLATEAWVEAKSYATETFVTDQDYATETFVADQGYASEAWVEAKGYTTENFVTGQGYATETFVTDQGYATEAWVDDQEFASEVWVEDQGFASEPWVLGLGYGSQADITALQAEVLTLQDQLATKIDPAPQDGTAYVRQDGQWLGLEGVLAALGYLPGGGGNPGTPEVPEIISGGDFSTGAPGSVDLTLGGGDFTTGAAGNGDATLDGGVFESDSSIPETVSGGDFATGSGGSADVTVSGGDFTSGEPGSEDATVDGGVFEAEAMTASGGDFTSGVGGGPDVSFGGGDFSSGAPGESNVTLDGGLFESEALTAGGGDFSTGTGGGIDVTFGGGDFATGAAGSGDVNLDGGDFSGGTINASGGDFTTGTGGTIDIAYGGGDFSTGGSGSEDVTLDGGVFAGGELTAGGGDFSTGGSGGPDISYGGGDFSTGGSGSGDVNLDGGDFGGPAASGGDFTSGQSGDDDSTYGAGDFSTGASSGEAVTMDGGDFTADGGGDFTSGGAGGAAVTFGAGDFTSGESSGAAVEMDGGDFSS